MIPVIIMGGILTGWFTPKCRICSGLSSGTSTQQNISRGHHAGFGSSAITPKSIEGMDYERSAIHWAGLSSP